MERERSVLSIWRLGLIAGSVYYRHTAESNMAVTCERTIDLSRAYMGFYFARLPDTSSPSARVQKRKPVMDEFIAPNIVFSEITDEDMNACLKAQSSRVMRRPDATNAYIVRYFPGLVETEVIYPHKHNTLRVVCFKSGMMSYRAARSLSLRRCRSMFIVGRSRKIRVNVSVFVNYTEHYDLGKPPLSPSDVGNGLHLPGNLVLGPLNARNGCPPRIIACALGKMLSHGVFDAVVATLDISPFCKASLGKYRVKIRGKGGNMDSITPEHMAPFLGYVAVLNLLKNGREMRVFYDKDSNDWDIPMQ